MVIPGGLSSAIAKSVAGKYAHYAMQLLSLSIMARLFSPQEFGVYAVLNVFAVFFVLVSELGFGPALVNERKIERGLRDGVYGFTLAIGLGLSFAFWLSSFPLAQFFGNPVYHLLSIPVSLSLLCSSAAVVPLACLQKESRFGAIAKADVTSEVVSLSAVLGLYGHFGHLFLLASKPLFFTACRYVCLWRYSRATEAGAPRFSWDYGQVKRVLHFSVYQALSNISIYFSRNLDNILVGKYFGTLSLGLYDKAYQLMRYPLQLLTFAMAPAIQPQMTQYRDDHEQFERIHNRFVLLLSVVGAVAGILVFLFAHLIVAVVLGGQWKPIVPLLQILAISIPTQIVLSSSGGFFLAAGEPRLMLRCTVFSVATNVAGILVGIMSGDLRVLCGMLVCTFFINYLQCHYVLSRHLFGGRVRGLLFPFVNVIGATCMMAILAIVRFRR